MSFASRTEKYSGKGLELLSIESSQPEVCLLSGSFPVGEAYYPKAKLLSESVALMLKEGTKKKSKEEIREILESRGASITFSGNELYTRFKLSALTEDFSKILELLEEILYSPAFPEKEWSIYKGRQISELEEARHDTNEMADITLLRKIYPEGHPYRELSIDESIKILKQTKASDLAKHHKATYAEAPLKLVFSGPAGKKQVNLVLKTLGRTRVSQPTLGNIPLLSPKSSEEEVEIKDKTSVMLSLGQALSINKNHPDFLALSLAVDALGGNFAARLVQEVREKRGLTYGTYAKVHNATNLLPGYFNVTATFAPAILKQGEAVVRATVEEWYKKGLYETELKERKVSSVGSHVVALSSNRNIVSSLLSNMENERGPEYLDKYPELVHQLSLEKVNSAIRKYIDPAKLVTVRAGSLKSARAK